MSEKKKEDPKEPKIHPNIAKLLDRGIPCWKAEFHAAVNNADEVPETMFSLESHVPSRQVKMWWIAGDGLLCFQKTKWWTVPASTVKFCKFMDVT